MGAIPALVSDRLPRSHCLPFLVTSLDCTPSALCFPLPDSSGGPRARPRQPRSRWFSAVNQVKVAVNADLERSDAIRAGQPAPSAQRETGPVPAIEMSCHLCFEMKANRWYEKRRPVHLVDAPRRNSPLLLSPRNLRPCRTAAAAPRPRLPGRRARRRRYNRRREIRVLTSLNITTSMKCS